MKNSVPPLLRTLRFCVGRQGGRIRQLQALLSQAEAAECPEPGDSLWGMKTGSEVQRRAAYLGCGAGQGGMEKLLLKAVSQDGLSLSLRASTE